jgi:pimeloyl-ACP methyl ester carboxylesterase
VTSARVVARSMGRATRGDAVVVPGLGVAAYLWPTVQALAAAGWRAWLLRPPGWPGNRMPSPEVAPSRLGDAVAAWLAGLDRRVLLVGQSVGTQIAAHAANAVPDRVAMLLLQGPTVDPAYRTTGRLTARWLLNGWHEPLRLACSQVPEWRQVGPRRLRSLVRGCLDDDLGATLADLDDAVPVQVVLGAQDLLCRRSWAATLATVPVLILPGAHAACATSPDAFAALVTAVAPELW